MKEKRVSDPDPFHFRHPDPALSKPGKNRRKITNTKTNFFIVNDVEIYQKICKKSTSYSLFFYSAEDTLLSESEVSAYYLKCLSYENISLLLTYSVVETRVR